MSEPHVGPMDFTGRSMTGFVIVEADGVADDDDLRAWVDRGVEFAGSLPPKQSRLPARICPEGV